MKVCAVDDHPIVLRGLSSYFEDRAACIEMTAVAPDVSTLMAGGPPAASVALLDVNLADDSSVDVNVTRLRAFGLGVLLYTGEHRLAVIRRGLDAGALGLILKEDPESAIIEAIHESHAGRFAVSSRIAHQIVSDPRGAVRLSEREREVLGLLARGLPWLVIGRQIGSSPETARTHCYRAVEKYIGAGAPSSLGPKGIAFQAVADGNVDTIHRAAMGALAGDLDS